MRVRDPRQDQTSACVQLSRCGRCDRAVRSNAHDRSVLDQNVRALQGGASQVENVSARKNDRECAARVSFDRCRRRLHWWNPCRSTFRRDSTSRQMGSQESSASDVRALFAFLIASRLGNVVVLQTLPARQFEARAAGCALVEQDAAGTNKAANAAESRKRGQKNKRINSHQSARYLTWLFGNFICKTENIPV